LAPEIRWPARPGQKERVILNGSGHAVVQLPARSETLSNPPSIDVGLPLGQSGP
jgi:hypothetical protein